MNRLTKLGLFVATIALICLPCVSAQWGLPGGKKKNKNADGAIRPEDVPGGLSFDDLQKIAQHERGGGRGERRAVTGIGGDGESSPMDLLQQMGDLKDVDMRAMVEEAMNSPEIQAMMEDPELMKAALKDSPLFNNLPGLDKILDRPEFNDPEELKRLFQEGVEQFKEVSETVLELINDPEKRDEVYAEMAKNLDPKERRKMKKLMEGDPEAIEEAAAQLAGAFASAGKELEKDLTDPEKLEKARKHFLDNQDWQDVFDDPDLKAAATDPAKWREIMMQNARLLYASEDEL